MNKLLLPQDVVGGSFWLISVAMIGAAIFFFLERGRLSPKWGTVMNLVGVIALMSSIHYFYAKNLWVLNGQAPTALRYIDWLLTFPLTILTFYVMLKSVTDIKRGMFWRLLVGTLVWVVAQLLGAYGYMSVTLGFLVGIVGWLYIIGELYMGDAGRANSSCNNERVQMAFFANRPMGATIRMTKDRRILIRNTAEVHNPFKMTQSDLNKRSIKQKIGIKKRFPQLPDNIIQSTWSGIVSRTRNSSQIFEKIDNNIFVVGCYNGSGIGVGTLFGEQIAIKASNENTKEIETIEARSKPTWLPPDPFLSLGVKTRLIYERFRARDEI